MAKTKADNKPVPAEQAPLVRVPNGVCIEEHMCQRDFVITKTYQRADGETETWRDAGECTPLEFVMCSGVDQPVYGEPPVAI